MPDLVVLILAAINGVILTVTAVVVWKLKRLGPPLVRVRSIETIGFLFSALMLFALAVSGKLLWDSSAGIVLNLMIMAACHVVLGMSFRGVIREGGVLIFEGWPRRIAWNSVQRAGNREQRIFLETDRGYSSLKVMSPSAPELEVLIARQMAKHHIDISVGEASVK